MSHITRGDRVYIVDSDSYGDVNRTTFLGKQGSVLVADDGTLGGFTSTETNEKIVNQTTGKNGLGVAIETPMDVKNEGVSILDAMNITSEQQSLMFSKFMAMFNKEERRAYVKDWKEKESDPVQRTLFLNNLVEDLDDDEVFITNEGTKALVDIEPEIQKKMFTKFLTTVDKKTREAYILEWVVSKNDKEKKDDFLQKMYELLMDDEDYIKMEGRKALSTIKMSYREQLTVFSRFLRVSTGQQREDYVKEWRSVRRSKSKRVFFLKNFIGLVETVPLNEEESSILSGATIV